jgi:hypothetical protein
MAVAAIARAMDVPLEVDGEPIPVAGFATVTIAAVGIGLALAAGLQHRHRFVVATVALTAVSLVPSIALPDHTATRVVLVLAHLIAAAIVIPLLASQLPERPPAR